MTCLIATIPLEEILQNPEHIPSPLIIRHFTRKPVMLSTLPQYVHTIYMGYGQPVYTYVIKDDWFKKHLPHLGCTYDSGVLNDLPKLMANYIANETRIRQIFPKDRLLALSQEDLYEKIQQFGETHTFKMADYYGFALENFELREI